MFLAVVMVVSTHLDETSKMLRATDRGFVFQLLPKQSWTKAVLEGKQYSFQLQKWQALWLFMSFTVCFVFISILLLERLLETACVGASCSPQRLAECSPPASRAVPSAARAQQQPGPQLNWKIIRGGGESPLLHAASFSQTTCSIEQF